MLNVRRNGSRFRRSTLGCETLESRVVLTYAGPSSLLGSLSYVGVVTTPIETTTLPLLPVTPVPVSAISSFSLGRATSIASWTKLRTDLQTLETELQTLAAKSGLTIADLENLTNDTQAIAQADFYFQARTLNPVISELAVAVAGNNIHEPGSNRIRWAFQLVERFEHDGYKHVQRPREGDPGLGRDDN